MNYEYPILVFPCYLQLSEAARLAYGVTKAELDDFLMYEFKVKRCAKAYPHQWMTCPYAHRGEKARRRDPRRFPNHGIPCPEFRQTGACRRGQKCEFAHGVFEFWLHPTRYRTRMCISGPACRRKICFFAHTVDELRPEGLGGGVPAGVGKLAEGTSAGGPEERGEEFAEPDLSLSPITSLACFPFFGSPFLTLSDLNFYDSLSTDPWCNVRDQLSPVLTAPSRFRLSKGIAAPSIPRAPLWSA
ncbi:unnamed protein product [Musa banksii]